MFWFALAVIGCAAIVWVTRVVGERAHLQNAADVVALALVTNGESDADVLADSIGVVIDRVTWRGMEATVVVSGPDGWATSTATR